MIRLNKKQREFLGVLPCIIYIFAGMPPYVLIIGAYSFPNHFDDLPPFLYLSASLFGLIVLQRKIYIWYYRDLFHFIFNR